MTTYDPDARRDTPLALKLNECLRRHGPITVAEYMDACLNDPEHGYYRRQLPIGSIGDFITAPEISQVFGELIGLWSVAVWQQMGAPAKVHLIELGAGRGTLMRDALRAARVVPDFLAAAHVSLVDVNPALRAAQKETLADVAQTANPIAFRDELTAEFLSEARDHPAILIANEFLDVWPVDQFIRQDAGWISRQVGLDVAGRLQFTEPSPSNAQGPPLPCSSEELDRRFPTACAGDVVTTARYDVFDDILTLWTVFSALFIDYGHSETKPGDTLQAVRNHAYEHPLTSPGEADLTAQVDFQAFRASIASCQSLAADGPITQAEFLGRLGIMERASRLMAANPEKAAEIESGVVRLMSPQGMGTRFKVVGVRTSNLPVLPAFE